MECAAILELCIIHDSLDLIYEEAHRESIVRPAKSALDFVVLDEIKIIKLWSFKTWSY